MLFIHNIQSVAKYESKILIRSWFFKVFTVLAIFVLFVFNFNILLPDDGYSPWIIKAIASNIPYANLLLLNTGQAVIAIFLASEFLKRDKQLDTSEVFYVRPLSNAEYVIGKIWGNVRVFLVLNIVIMGMALVFNYMATETTVDWMAYLIYFGLISIPTLVFIIGLSIFLMLVFKNQALTFIILLGYIGLTIFYIEDKFYYLFDYMAYSLPLFKSTIVGFTNPETLINHRAIYLFLGLGFIFFTIFLFMRLPNSSKSHYPWLVISLCMFMLGIGAGYRHIYSFLGDADLRKAYTELNNKYVHSPKMVIDQYDIVLEQYPDSFSSEVKMKGVALETSSTFTFCLNPGLNIREIKSDDKVLDFTREKQIILVNFPSPIAKGDTAELSIVYGGKIDETLCYLDIPAEILEKKNSNFLYNIDKRYVFQTEKFVLMTPETYWYPRPGTAYSDKSPDWQQTYFSKFNLKVKPLEGLIPLSQGAAQKEEEKGEYAFSIEYPVQSISLVIGDYEQKSVEVDSTLYSLWYIKGHDYFSSSFDSITDTIPTFLREMRGNLERPYNLSYPFKRFSVIEVPGQFFTYPRAWSQAQETAQPEMVLFPEKGYSFYQLNVVEYKKRMFEWARWDGRELSDKEASINALYSFLWIFLRSEGNFSFSSGERGRGNISSQSNPYFLFPQLYNFRYNIFSAEWPIANRLIELYLQRKSSDMGWERQINGISNNEKANLLMEKHQLKDLLADVKYRDLVDNIIALRGDQLFSHPEMSIGVKAFRDSLYAVLERNTFGNVQFELLLDTLGTLSETDIRSYVPEWNKLTPLPFYTIVSPKVMRIRDRDKEIYRMEVVVSNDSDNDGVIFMGIGVSGKWGDNAEPRQNRKISIAAHETKKLVSIWDDAPRYVNINTMISGNLPGYINQQIGDIKRERGLTSETDSDYVVPSTVLDVPGEIIVDNEDSLSFTLSKPDVVGLLPKWLDKVDDNSFKYRGVFWWRTPLEWTPSTDAGYYGKYIRSAYVVKSGKGDQTATWKVEVPEEGQYEVYYYVYRSPDIRYGRNNGKREYHFKIQYGEESEDGYIDLKQANDGWEQIGVYYFKPGTVNVVLSNKTELRSVIADAVKFVKR